MPLVEVFVLFLAVYGVTFLFYYTDGPWDFFFRFRSFLIGLDSIKLRKVHIVEEQQEDGFFQKLFSCFWCFSFWVALFIVGSYYLLYDYPIKSFPYVVAASIGVTGYLNERLASG